MLRRVSAGVVLLFTLFTVSLFAQSPTANIVGRVVDQTGAVIADAKIRVRHVEMSELREVSTDASGEYTVANLPPGHYQIMVEKEGFKRLDERGLELQIDQTARLDFTLQVGAVTEVVEVTAAAPVLTTDSPMKGDVIASREMVDIPLDGRDFGDLAYLVPGVSEAAQGGQGSNFAVNGARADNTNFIIDGFNNQNPRGGSAQARPPIDGIMEFKMQTTGYSAEYGRLAGGTMNMALKSGTNRLHGSLFEFVRNDLFDARNFFDPEKAKLRRNQFGGVFDGPVAVPKIYNGRNRTFFLFNYEGYRQAQASSNLDIVPTLLERQGDFSQTMLPAPDGKLKHVALLDPAATGTCAGTKLACFPNQRIPAARFDSIAKQVLAYYPLPNRAGVNNLYAQANDPDHWDSFLGKIDHRVGSADSFSFRYMKRYIRTSTPFDGGNTGLFGSHTGNHQMLTGLSYTRIFSATLINEFRAGLSRTANRQAHNNQGHDYASEWGLKGFTTDPFLTGFPRFVVTNMVELGDDKSQPVIFTVNNLQWADTLTWVKGRHLMKFGADIQRTQFFQPFYNNNRGQINFNGRYAGVATPNLAYDPPATAVPFADFLLGLPNQVTRTVGVNPNYLFFTTYGFFAQDDFKVTRSLTLNLGLRYELPQAPHEKYGRFSNFVPELGKVLIADDKTVPNLQQMIAEQGLTGKMILARDAGFPQSLLYTPYKCFAPRFGFAWRPFGGQRNVVRGGYGIFYGSNVWNPVRNNLGNVFPFDVEQTFAKNANLTLQNPQGVTPSTDGVLTPNGFQAHATPAYLQSWNLTVEREVGKGTGLEIAYVGSKGTHLGRIYDINQWYRLPEYAPNYPSPFPGFNAVNYFGFGFNSIYNAGIISLRKRITRGFFYRVNYTYSKSIDNSSQISDNSDGGAGNPQNVRDFKAERGRSDWDRGHSVTTMFMYDLPLRQNPLLRNWQVGGSGRFSTGPPFSPDVSGGTLHQGQATRPDRIAKGTVPNPTPDMWFDLTAFPNLDTSGYRFGNTGRNILDGPGLLSLNVSLIRRFRIRERGTMQFRAEMFNALNHPNFRLPNRNADAPDGGVIKNAGSPRLMQFSLRYQF